GPVGLGHMQGLGDRLRNHRGERRAADVQDGGALLNGHDPDHENLLTAPTFYASGRTLTCMEAALLISSEPRKWKVRSRSMHSSAGSRTDEGERDRERRSLHMPATGELIRLMNYVDDISATLRRISSTIGTMTAEEKKRLSEYMRAATNGFNDVLTQLEKQ